MAKKKMIGSSAGSKVFTVINIAVLLLFTVITFYPMYYIAITSVSNGMLVMQGKVNLYPIGLTLDSYKSIMADPQLFRSLWNSVLYTVLGTVINLIMSCLCAFPLSRRTFSGRNFFTGMIVFTMFFGGGMIPTFLVIKGLGLLDSLWALMIPGAISTWNLIIIKNFFQGIPAELEEAAKIDGAGDLRVLLQIVLPLSKPMLATFALFYAVGYWNSYTSALLYINDMKKWTLQIMLRQIIMLSNGAIDGSEFDETATRPPSESIQMAVIVFGTLPILCVYPFLQKHFTKGVLVGAIKG